MNIEQALPWSSEKPAVLPLRKTEKLNRIALGLEKEQVLAKHHMVFPPLLNVLSGEIAFLMEGETITLGPLDTFDIPVRVPHSVRGTTHSVFTLLMEK